MEEDHKMMVDVISQFQTKNSRIPVILTVKKEFYVVQKSDFQRKVHSVSVNFPEDSSVQVGTDAPNDEANQTIRTQQTGTKGVASVGVKNTTHSVVKKVTSLSGKAVSNSKDDGVQTEELPKRSIGTNTIKVSRFHDFKV